jgi:hypothetical protein
MFHSAGREDIIKNITVYSPGRVFEGKRFIHFGKHSPECLSSAVACPVMNCLHSYTERFFSLDFRDCRRAERGKEVLFIVLLNRARWKLEWMLSYFHNIPERWPERKGKASDGEGKEYECIWTTI